MSEMTTADYGPGTALLVVDMQNDFVDPDGSLYVSGGERIVPLVNDEIAKAEAAGSPVLYTQDWHPESTPHFQKDGGIWPVHCVGGTWGAEFHPDLRVIGESIKKGTGGEDGYSGFSMRDPLTADETPTPLVDRLRALEIGRVVVVGTATDYCVMSTALDAVRLGFATRVRSDAIAAVNLKPGDGDRALEAMAAGGVDIS
jgi:nicotinamidase/pyrazinamidase